jgi:hypothetical protein
VSAVRLRAVSPVASSSRAGGQLLAVRIFRRALERRNLLAAWAAAAELASPSRSLTRWRSACSCAIASRTGLRGWRCVGTRASAPRRRGRLEEGRLLLDLLGGGSVCLTVTPGWTGVISFLITDVAGDTCNFLWWQFRFSPLPIVNRSFNEPNVLTGSFSTDRGAQGTIVVTDSAPPPCTTGTVTWTATTDGSPPWLTPALPPRPPPPAFPSPVRPPTQARCVVPNVKGKTVTQARRLLASKRCGLGRVRRAYSAKIKRGHVISQSRRPGVRLSRGSRVNVVVSRGRRR